MSAFSGFLQTLKTIQKLLLLRQSTLLRRCASFGISPRKPFGPRRALRAFLYPAHALLSLRLTLHRPWNEALEFPLKLAP